ncbi:MAG: hypothetical protein CMD25_00470 [Flavobacteriales bacterium]|nr:hypothetical protein [Flavobacteriales bacterium]|tara:strand:+ start:11024 stop:12658 length:1635 start_codon:yes stop_codon:yes gene_type:complete
MIIYSQETDDGLAEKISASNSISYASIVEPCDIEQNQIKTKSMAAMNDADLYYVQSILVSSSWNRNDDVFDRAEVWAARKTPEHKPTNLEHDENLIIGHITSNWPIDNQGKTIAEDIEVDELPDKFHIVTGSVIYKAYSSPELKERAEKLIAEIENGTKYVSMECYFKGFDYGLTDKVTGDYKVLARNDSTAYLTKYLKAYGGQGEHDNYKIGRVLRNITFSGKGFVNKPANPDSIIFNKRLIEDLLDKKNDNLLKTGVLENKPTINTDTENIVMSENIEKQVAEINEKLDSVSVNCADQVAEAQATASELQQTNQTLEATMKEKEELLEAKSEELETLAKKHDEEVKSKKEEMAEMKKEKEEAKSELEEVVASKTELEEALKAAQTSLEEANEVIAGYKMKEEEMAKKEMLAKRKANLVEAGLEDDAASAAVEKFESLDDEAFESITSLLAAMKPKEEEKAKKHDETEAAMPPALKEALEKKKEEKEKASELEEAESALEEVEAEETVDLSVGNDESETESAEASVRSELVEFVSARLGNTSK